MHRLCPRQRQQSSRHPSTSTKAINKGALQAFVKVTIVGKVTINEVRIIHEQGKEAWVAMPQRQIPAKDGGESRWVPIVELVEEKLKQQITRVVLDAWRSGSLRF